MSNDLITILWIAMLLLWPDGSDNGDRTNDVIQPESSAKSSQLQVYEPDGLDNADRAKDVIQRESSRNSSQLKVYERPAATEIARIETLVPSGQLTTGFPTFS